MKPWLVLAFLLSYSPVIAQQAAYQPFDVDSVAEPRGGVAFLNTFIQANLVKPTAAEAQGISGRVIVGGIVEPSGRISNVNVIKSFRSDCDREAVRVFSLFNAWKPAHKAGKAVRQQVNLPILFPQNKPFQYTDGVIVTYFDGSNKPVADSSRARYKQLAPTDSAGLPTEAIVLYKRTGTFWKEERRLPLIRQKLQLGTLPGQYISKVGYRNTDEQWHGLTYDVNGLGRLLTKEYYEAGKPAGPRLTFFENGAVAEKTEDFATNYTITSWYDNGQTRSVKTADKPKAFMISKPESMIAFWSKAGHQLVKGGNGRVVDTVLVNSRIDNTELTLFMEQGVYQNSLKQGVWTGLYADGSYFYEEVYDDGVCISGKSKTTGTDTLRYTAQEQQPEFVGGMPKLKQFLERNLKYPASARRDGVGGTVFVGFVIDTDGSVTNVQLIKGIGSGADEEAMRVVKATNGSWKPGIQRGQTVRTKYIMPINFNL